MLLALPARASAHAIPGLVHDARDVVLSQAPGTHTAIAADGVHLELRRAGASVVEVLDPQGRPALKLDARGAWARRGAPILSVLSVATGAPDPRDAAWLRAGSGSSLRFHYPGTHGEIVHRWRVPLRVDGRGVAILGAVERVPRPSLAWPIGAVATVVAVVALALVLTLRRRCRLRALRRADRPSRRRPLRRERGRVRALVGGARRRCRGARRARTALRLRRDAALELGALAVAAVLLALPLVGRLTVLRHGVIVTTIDPGLERALVVGGLAFAAGVIAAAARSLVADARALVREPSASATTGTIRSRPRAAPRLSPTA